MTENINILGTHFGISGRKCVGWSCGQREYTEVLGIDPGARRRWSFRTQPPLLVVKLTPSDALRPLDNDRGVCLQHFVTPTVSCAVVLT
jgi:hypothetical protein